VKTKVETLGHQSVLKASTLNAQTNWYINFLEKQCEIASIQHTPLSVVIIKIRDFDQLINTHGWASVDEDITGLSKLITKELFHSLDVMVRYQRDRFLCILPDSGPEATRHYIFMLQRAIAKHNPLKLANKHNPAFLCIAGVTKLDGKFDGATILEEVERCVVSTLSKSLGTLSGERVSSILHIHSQRIMAECLFYQQTATNLAYNINSHPVTSDI